MREGIQAFLCHTKLLTTNIALAHKFVLNDPFYSITVFDRKYFHYLPNYPLSSFVVRQLQAIICSLSLFVSLHENFRFIPTITHIYSLCILLFLVVFYCMEVSLYAYSLFLSA